MACDMTAIPHDQRSKLLALGRELFSTIEEFRELPTGYEIRLADQEDLLVKLAQFISLEKLCCPFLKFAVEVEAENGPVWLRLTGRDGVKTFIREKINGVLSAGG